MQTREGFFSASRGVNTGEASNDYPQGQDRKDVMRSAILADRYSAQLFGGLLAFWGASHCWTEWEPTAGRRITVVLLQGVWAFYGGLLIAWQSRGAQYGLHIPVEPLSLLFFFVIPLTIGGVLVFDERVKAYFGQGRFAEGYRAYVNTYWEGQSETPPNPWTIEEKEPSMGADRGLINLIWRRKESM